MRGMIWSRGESKSSWSSISVTTYCNQPADRVTDMLGNLDPTARLLTIKMPSRFAVYCIDDGDLTMG